MILQNFENLTGAQRQMFADTVVRLLASAFLARDKKDNKELYGT